VLVLGGVGGQYTVAEHRVIEVKVALLLVVGLLHLLAAVLVLGGCEALITDASVGALQVLTGPVGKAQAGVLAAFVYVLALPAAYQPMPLGTQTPVGAVGVDAITPNAGRGEVTLINVLASAPVSRQMVARDALTLEGARRVGAHAIVTHIPSLTLIHILAAAAIRRRRVALGARAAEGAWEILAPARRAGAALGTLVHVAAGPAPLAAVAGLTGNALEAPGFVLAFAIRAGARVSALVDVFAHGRS